jgi:type II secretory pathway component GspD/PulD (secretin)
MAALAAFGLASPAPTAAAETQSGTNVIPTIVMEEVPLPDAIRSLAQMAGINFILDPRLASRELVSLRWENRTAGGALDELLKQRALKLVRNPETSIARIAYSTQQVSVVSCPDCTGTNAVVPIITMDDAPLDQAIRKLAQAAHLNVSIDKSITSPPGPGLRPRSEPPMVSFRWTHLTARQALLGLLDNYDLTMIDDQGQGGASIRPKPTQSAP